MKRFRDGDDDGGDDSGGAFRRSSVRPRTSGGRANKLTTMDASTYLKEIKETFKDQKEKHDEFFDAMKDFNAHRVDAPSFIARVRRVFQGYPNLISGFNTFYPKEYEITIDEPQAKKPVESQAYRSVNKINVLLLTIMDALTYLKQVKETFKDQKEKYDEFLDALENFKAHRVDTLRIIARVTRLFEGYPDLILGFDTFLPKGGRRGNNSRDFISEMPDDILIMILSLLPVKDAIVTSILSTRWRFLWSFLTNLNFDGTENWSGNEQPKYINHVNSVIQSYKHPIVKDFRIRMPLRGRHMGVIDEWLQFVVNKKVEFLELDLMRTGQNYDFPSRVFEAKIFRSPSSSNSKVVGISSLKKLTLKSVNVTDSIFQEFLTNCPHLETIVIHYSARLNHIRVGGRALNLKHFEIATSSYVRSIYLSDFDLVSFTYIGPKIDLRLTNLPKLQNLDMCKEDFSMSDTTVFNNISSCALSLQALSINISPVESVMLDSIPELPNLRTLRLAMYGSRYDCLLYLAFILRACPNLVNFTIRPLWTSPLIGRREERDVINNLNAKLKFVGIEGYYGRKCDLKLAKYMIQTAVALKKIVIYDPYVWTFRLPSPACYKFLRNRETTRSTTTRQLKPILPKGVELCILL